MQLRREVVVYSSPTLTEAHLVRSVLTRERIWSRLRHDHLSALAGQLPVNEVRVEVLVEAADAPAALEVLDTAQRVRGWPRPCPSCGEENPPAFEICWSCGADVPRG